MAFRLAVLRSAALATALASALVPVLGAPVSAQPAVPVYHARRGEVNVRLGAARADSVVVDGRLDEPVWRTAPVLTGFSLYQPTDGQPAPDSTEVRVWHSRDALHIGVRAFEPHGVVRATLADRDRIGADDYVEIHLDPFLERRRAVVFIVNPFGIQADGTKSEGGGFIPGSNIAPGQNDLSADFLWQSRGQLTDTGYDVELRIPWVSIRFPGHGEQRWGIQVVRKVQHSGYEQTWTPVSRGAASFIAQAGTLSGMTGMERGLDVLLNPELTNTRSGTSPLTDSTRWRYTNTPNVGGNVRVGLGSNFVLNGSIRPDFSQVEADAIQVAADPRFALFYPERRLFFVEGAEAFNVPNTLLYTRRIVQPDAALKLTGRVGRTNVALLSALDAPPSGADTDGPLVNVFRATRDFRLQSQAGLVYSDRVGGGMTHRMIGGDVRHVFGGLYYVQAQVAASRTRNVLQNNGRIDEGLLWEAVLDRTGRQWGYHYNLIGIQPGFRSENGFVARTGFVQPNIANRFTIFGTPGRLFERYQVFVQTNALWRYADFFAGRSLLESRASANNTVTLRRGWQVGYTPTLSSYAFDPSSFARFRVVQDGVPQPFTPSPRIHTFAQQFTLTTPQFRRLFATASVLRANDVDFVEAAPTARTAVSASVDWRPDTRLRVNATYASNQFVREVDGNIAFSTQIPRVKAEYQVTRFVFVRLIAQYEAQRREAMRDWRTGLPVFTTEAPGQLLPTIGTRNDVWRADWLFAFRPSPGTVVFAGYGSGYTDTEITGLDAYRRSSNGLFVKASWVNRL